MKSIVMMTALSLAAGTFIGSGASAAALRPSQAMSRQGEVVVVEGIAHVQDNGGLRLADSGSGHLTITIPANMKDKMPDLASYDGKTVDVSGMVEIGARGP